MKTKNKNKVITPENRVYGIPFFKVTIAFINNRGDCIGDHHIRATTAEPIEMIGTQEVFKDIDGSTFYCPKGDWHCHGPANETEMNDLYG